MEFVLLLVPELLFYVSKPISSVFTGKSKTKENRQSIINPDWNFEKMGIGGLDKEFSDIFRRAFASRVFPPEIVEQMGEWELVRVRGRGVGCNGGVSANTSWMLQAPSAPGPPKCLLLLD